MGLRKEADGRGGFTTEALRAQGGQRGRGIFTAKDAKGAKKGEAGKRDWMRINAERERSFDFAQDDPEFAQDDR